MGLIFNSEHDKSVQPFELASPPLQQRQQLGFLAELPASTKIPR